MDKDKFKAYLKDKDKKHIIFDFDHTLCDLFIDWGNWAKEMQELYRSFGIILDPEKYGYLQLQNMCVEKYGNDARDKILEINYRNERDYSSGYKLLPSTISILSLVQKFAHLYIWSSNDQKTILPILNEADMDKVFLKVIARNNVKYVKPSSEGFYLIYDKNKRKSEYLMIGDSQVDKEAAKEAGIDFINISEFEKQ